MPTEHASTSPSGLDVTKLLSELEVRFYPTKSGAGYCLARLAVNRRLQGKGIG